jgi:sulfopropanediol 3-dehydrogenase
MMGDVLTLPGELVKAPAARIARRDPAVTDRVSEMLAAIEKGGADAVRRYARELDGWRRPSFELPPAQVRRAAEEIDDDVRESIDFAAAQIEGFARRQRETLVDFECEPLPGVVLGQRQVPVASVGAYAPAGRIPMLACPLMTVLVAKVAGVERVVCCTPPDRAGEVHRPTLYSIARAGADAVFAIGGVQALAAMAFGIEGMGPVDKLVGPGNAYVAEAKRQLFGRVGIDLLAGPSEVAVIADETADPELVAADLLGQAEHGPQSPAVLITPSRELAEQVTPEVERQVSRIEELDPDTAVRTAWNDHGAILLVRDRQQAAAASDVLAPEHLEVQTADDGWFHRRLRNYGSLFLGERATVAFSDKAIGTNHVLPTAGATRYTGGLSVASYLKTLTFQRIDSDEGVRVVGEHVARLASADRMPAHEATAVRRLRRIGAIGRA